MALQDQTKRPNYGGSNDVIISVCPRCQESPDKHKPFQWIGSTEASEKLLVMFQRSLDEVAKDMAEREDLRTAYVKAATGGGGTVYATSMMGAAIATIGTAVRNYVTLSGPGPSIIAKWIKYDQLPKDVIVVEMTNCLASGKLMDINGKRFTPTFTPQGRRRDYPLGSCAAQKLLNEILGDAKNLGQKINSIQMSEMFWRDFATETYNRDWSTGQIVPSCDTCKQVLPQMLCSNIDD